ncbi:MAG: WYL domain-containing protein [Candidatus Omnitrophota bacterium]
MEKVKQLKSKKSRDIYCKIDMIIIDEISMVRPDLLDCVDKFLRLNAKDKKTPFGGVQMVFFGDLYQLPPVVSYKERAVFASQYKGSYFFDSQVFTRGGFDMEFIELNKIYRQTDKLFIGLLNSIRNNSVEEHHLQLLNSRLQKDTRHNSVKNSIYLTTTNRLAARINEERLNRLKSRGYSYQGSVEGDFAKEHLPADFELKIKPGAQVMLLNNDSFGRWINGTIGCVERIKEQKGEEDIIEVRLPGGEVEDVCQYTWEVFHFRFNEGTAVIESDVVGRFTQYPLKLAYAVTIHKSQGKTFDKVVLDISDGVFACGQIYVALSRCRCLEGISLTRPIQKKHIFVDRKIMDFLTAYQYKISEENMPLNEKIRRIEEAIDKNKKLDIIYLKANDEKSRRVIRPLSVGTMSYQDKEFSGVEAHCFKRSETRVFRVDRILEMKEAEDFFAASIGGERF